MVAVGRRLRLEGRRRHPEAGRQRRRCRGRRRLRPRGHATPARKHRRRRLHGHPPGRWPGDDNRLPRGGAGRRAARHVPRRARAIPSRSAASSVRSPRACRAASRASRSRSRKYGRLPLATVMAPAIALARDGFEISWSFAASLASHQRAVLAVPLYRPRVPAARRHRRLTPASDCVQPDLATTLAGHRAARAGRVLPRPHRAPDRRRDVADRRADHDRRSRRATSRSSARPRRHVPRAPHRLDGAAQFRRRRAAAAAEHPRGVPARASTATTRRARCT